MQINRRVVETTTAPCQNTSSLCCISFTFVLTSDPLTYIEKEMGWISLFGCLTTAYGPAVVLFLMLVAPKAQLFMVFILRFANMCNHY
jgi:hypothetical protein